MAKLFRYSHYSVCVIHSITILLDKTPDKTMYVSYNHDAMTGLHTYL